MKKILLLISLGIMAIGYGQTQLENPGFEGIWEDVPGDEDEPIEWSSVKTADALGALAPIVAFKSLDAHSGTYSIRLKNALVFGIVANGILTNGRIHADFDAAAGYVFTDVANPAWNTVFNDRPDSLVAWVKYAPMGADEGKIEVILHDNSKMGLLPETESFDHWVGKARSPITSTAGEWKRIAVPFNYFKDSNPDHVLVVITSGDSTMAVNGSEMWMDDIELIYNINSVAITPADVQNNNIDEDGDILTVEEFANAAVVAEIKREWKYSLVSGAGYTAFDTPETAMTYTPNFATTGIYYIVCVTDFGTEVLTSNEVEIVVTDPAVNTVSVSPASVQNIGVIMDGALLTATETPLSADSREWKWSLTSGTGYVSFDSPVLTNSYTPNFDAIATYYVVCESDFAGDIKVSNEVKIMVTWDLGIHTDELDFSIYTNSNGINIDYSAYENATFSLYSIEGKLIKTQPLVNSFTTIDFDQNGIFIYRVIQGNTIITGKITR